MNNLQHKFSTTLIIFIIIVIGVFVGAQFKDISFINIALLLVNALLLLIILSILLMVKEKLNEKAKKR